MRYFFLLYQMLHPYVTDRYLTNVDGAYHSCKIKVIMKIKRIKSEKKNSILKASLRNKAFTPCYTAERHSVKPR